MAIPAGTRLGSYEILSAIGAGGMGEVYRARDTRLGRDVAIKVLPPNFVNDEERLARFQREARILAALNHANIATIYGLEQSGAVICLVMELVPGETLAERMRGGPLRVDEALKIAIQIAEALEAAHEKNIIHRDLKPANVKVTPEGKVKVLDFGLAKAFEGDEASVDIDNSPTLSRAATLQGVIQGTAAYMSPEQARGKTVDKRTDIWAFGVVLCEVLTGRSLFSGETVSDILAEVIAREPDLSALPAFPRSIVERCLRKDPRERWQAIGDVRIALQEGPPKVALAARKKQTMLPWAIAAILALTLTIVTFLERSNKPEEQYTTVTYREGILGAARFSHDGQTVIYDGEWEGSPSQIATYRVGNPESRDLGIASATVANVSSSDQLAVLRNCEHIFVLDCGGILATVSLAGGSPRDLVPNIAYADWSPDGKQLLESKISAEGTTLEFPPGHVLYEQKAGWFGRPRFSPDGNAIAFENHPEYGDDSGEVDMVDLNGRRTVLSKGWSSLEGLAWSPSGKEVWYAANSAHAGWADSIHAVTRSGKDRTVLHMPDLRLHDIASDGRVLLSREHWRGQMLGYFPGDKGEHPYSWLDLTTPTAISGDGRTLSFDETGEGGDTVSLDYRCYVRATDGTAPVSLGAGEATISPDGKWVLVSSALTHKMQLQPVSLGQPRDLPTPGLVNFDHAACSDPRSQVLRVLDSPTFVCPVYCKQRSLK